MPIPHNGYGNLYARANSVLEIIEESPNNLTEIEYILSELQQKFGSPQKVYGTMDFLIEEQKIAVQKFNGKSYAALIPKHLTRYNKARMQTIREVFLEISRASLA